MNAFIASALCRGKSHDAPIASRLRRNRRGMAKAIVPIALRHAVAISTVKGG